VRFVAKRGVEQLLDGLMSTGWLLFDEDGICLVEEGFVFLHKVRDAIGERVAVAQLALPSRHPLVTQRRQIHDAKRAGDQSAAITIEDGVGEVDDTHVD
jgi:hypothetical protein